MTGTASPLAAVRPPQAESSASAATAITPIRTMSVTDVLIFARLALVAVVAFAVGCGGGAEPRACSPAITGEPERRPPAGMALPAGAHLYLSEGPFGKTERFYAVLDGGEDELVAKRDVAADALVGARLQAAAQGRRAADRGRGARRGRGR